jgi:hypothetical protein
MAVDSASPRTKRPPPRPTAYRNGRPVPVVALHQGHLPRRGPPFQARTRNPDHANEKKWEPGRATELAARLGIARAYDERITACERGWPAYDASTDPHTRRWRQRQAYLQQAASSATARRDPTAGVRAGQPQAHRASTPQRSGAHRTKGTGDPPRAVLGRVRYWDGGGFVLRQRGVLRTEAHTSAHAGDAARSRSARRPWVSRTC